MSIKEKIIEILKTGKVSIEDITKKLSEKYQINTSEALVRTYVWRLIHKEHYPLKECGTINRYRVYELQNVEFPQNSKLIETLILLMIKAGIRSEDYNININDSEIEPYINKLIEGGIID